MGRCNERIQNPEVWSRDGRAGPGRGRRTAEGGPGSTARGGVWPVGGASRRPAPGAELSCSPQAAGTRSLLPPERSCGAGRAGADPGNPDAAARARGRGDRRGSRRQGSRHGVPQGGVSEASGSRPREAAPVSAAGVLGGLEGEGPRRTPIPTWAQTLTRCMGGGSTHLSRFLPPPPTAPLSPVLSRSSSRSFSFAPPHSSLYPFLWDCMSPSLGL